MASQPVTIAALIIAGAERYERLASAGPTQIASSASCTGSDSRSASLYATTASTPSVRHARSTRSAISPRFAIRILRNTSALPRRSPDELDDDELLAVLDCLAGLDEARSDETVVRRDDLLG